MAEPQSGGQGRESLLATLQKKVGPAPLWVWALLGVIALGLFLMHQKSKAKSTTDTQGGNPSNSTADLPDLTAAGYPMPYSGGDVFVNYPQQPTDHTHEGHGGTPLPVINATQPTYTYTVQPGDTLYSIVKNWSSTRGTTSESGIQANMNTIRGFNQAILHGKDVKAGEQIVLPSNPRGYF